MSSTVRSSKAKRRTRNVKRIATNIMLAPGKMPRITGEKSERIMRTCEVASLIFVAVLMLHLMVPEIVGTILVVVAGVIFASLLGMLLLGDYQDKLVEYELYGFRL